MRSRTVLAVALPFAVACGVGDRDRETMDTGDFWVSVDVECRSTELTLTAESDAAVTIEAEVWAGEDAVGTVDLVDRGAGDWFANTDDTQLLRVCDSGGYILFLATDANGNTVEDTWSY